MNNRDLRYHYHPQKGWLNDPNGLVSFGGYHHIFYQHTPHYERPGGESMVWGHTRTKDFLSWEDLPVALDADMPYDKGGVWSGTAFVKDGLLYAFYAAICDGKQAICAAVSEDGVTFRKFENNPIIPTYPADGSNDFRDPAIFEDHGRFYLVIASANPAKKTGNLLLYESANLTAWEYRGVLYEYEDCRFCECPSFIRYGDGDKCILSASVVRNSGEHFFEVLYGTFDGSAFTPEIVSHFQKGPDEYAGQIYRAADGRAIMISWVSGWNYTDFETCIGCLSIPLELTVKDGKIFAYPVKELQHLINDRGQIVDGYVTETYANGGEEVFIHLDGALLDPRMKRPE